MTELPDEIWNHILEFTLDWKSSHKRKMKPILENNIVECYKEVYERWTVFPPWPTSTAIIIDEYQNRQFFDWAPPPDLPLTSITWNINANKNGGWWCGYGWTKKNKYI
tara:strand:- start:18342 stop:18665 length:324 start_codon:yes stop_codon:yes gene_type:complete